jgi:superfamily II DNA or RNA helicase
MLLGSVIYSSAYECVRRACEATVHREETSVSDNNNPFSILFLVPRIVLVQQNINRLTRYGIPQERIGAYFGESKEVGEITALIEIVIHYFGTYTAARLYNKLAFYNNSCCHCMKFRAYTNHHLQM